MVRVMSFDVRVGAFTAHDANAEDWFEKPAEKEEELEPTEDLWIPKRVTLGQPLTLRSSV